jgi:endo-1,4-beta-xylanase
MVALKTLSLLAASAGLVAADGLNARAQADAGKKYFGTEVSSTVLRDSAADTIAKNFEDFGQYTCENVGILADTCEGLEMLTLVACRR